MSRSFSLAGELDHLNADRKRLADELRDVNDRLETKTGDPVGLKERGANLLRGIAKLDGEIGVKDAEFRTAMIDQFEGGNVHGENGGDANLDGWQGASGFTGVANPLDVSPGHLAGLQKGIEAARRGDIELKATMLTSDLGARRAWGSNMLGGPRMLHVVGGVQTQTVDSVFSQHPQFTLPAAVAGVGEGVTLTEYDASNAGSVTALRFGRFSDLSGESLLSADARSVMQVHTIGIGKDLDVSLQAKLETDAGTAVVFNADVPAAIRKQIAIVADNTSSGPEDLVIVANPNDVHLLEDVAPIGGRTIAEAFTRFSGAVVYPTSAQDAGFMLIANLRVGVRYFRAQDIRTETDDNIKTSVLTVATSLIGGYGTNIISGYVKSQDVVTP